MRKILLITLLSTFVFAEDPQILRPDKKELKEVEKQILKQNHQNLKNNWISPVTISSSLSRNHSFDEQSDTFTKSLSLGFTQNIYESGGIKFTIKYADDKYKSDLLSWENDNKQTLETIYETLLQIKKLKLELKQSEYELQNKQITFILKKIQYENGKTDITELNNALMAKNTQLKQNINLENSIKEQKLTLAKYTDLKYEQIGLIDFSNVNKEDYLHNNIELLYQQSLVDVANSSYKKLQTDYLPKLSLSTNVSYTNSDDLTYDLQNKDTAGSISLNLSMPLYDINKQSTIEKSKLELLKQKVTFNDLKNQMEQEFESTLTQIDTYKKYNKIINDNITLYNELIKVNSVSNQAGMSSKYDLEILQNTKAINQYDLAINNVNIQLEYTKLYFKIKVDNR